MTRANRLFRAVLRLASAACFVHAAPSPAQDYPGKPVRIIVANAPGSVLELAARILAGDLVRSLGQPVVVESRPGASGIIAYEHVIKQSPADGYTLALCASELITLPIFIKDLSFDPLRDLPPISLVAEGVSVVFTRYDAPWTDYKSFVSYVRANPGKANYGTAPFGLSRLIAELVRQKNELDMIFIPYKGGTAATTPAVLSGEIQLSVFSEALEPYVKDRRARALVIASSRRVASLPDAPTFAEVGVPEMPPGFVFAVQGRAGLPKPVVDRLNAAIVAAAQSNEVREQLARVKLYAVSSTPDAALKKLAEQASLFAAVAKKAGIQPQ